MISKCSICGENDSIITYNGSDICCKCMSGSYSFDTINELAYVMYMACSYGAVDKEVSATSLTGGIIFNFESPVDAKTFWTWCTMNNKQISAIDESYGRYKVIYWLEGGD